MSDRFSVVTTAAPARSQSAFPIQEAALIFGAVLGVQLAVGVIAWIAGWRTYGEFLIWFGLVFELGGVAAVIWLRRFVLLPLWRISAGLEVLDELSTASSVEARAARRRMHDLPPPLVRCGMGVWEAHYRTELLFWAEWTWRWWAVVTAAAAIGALAFWFPELFR